MWPDDPAEIARLEALAETPRSAGAAEAAVSDPAGGETPDAAAARVGA
jgi:hypothetical protein